MKPTSAALFLLTVLLASTTVCALPGIRPWAPKDKDVPSSQDTSRRSPYPIEGRVTRRRRLSSSLESGSSTHSGQGNRDSMLDNANSRVTRSVISSIRDVLGALMNRGRGSIGDPWIPQRHHTLLLRAFAAMPHTNPGNDDYMRWLAYIRDGEGVHFEEDLANTHIGDSSPDNMERINCIYYLIDDLIHWFWHVARHNPEGIEFRGNAIILMGYWSTRRPRVLHERPRPQARNPPVQMTPSSFS
ncbi:MAG: hypothetical protein DHS80DRAFT_22843 [Piptocephalis tieghemiana]|nr:MAG: hypothetical protein DHS80DRAFT_22843 [Piptocephalis tieghemiana]